MNIIRLRHSRANCIQDDGKPKNLYIYIYCVKLFDVVCVSVRLRCPELLGFGSSVGFGSSAFHVANAEAHLDFNFRL